MAIEGADEFKARYRRDFGTDDLDPFLLAQTFPATCGDVNELLHLYNIKVERAHPMPDDSAHSPTELGGAIPLPFRSPAFPHSPTKARGRDVWSEGVSSF